MYSTSVIIEQISAHEFVRMGCTQLDFFFLSSIIKKQKTTNKISVGLIQRKMFPVNLCFLRTQALSFINKHKYTPIMHALLTVDFSQQQEKPNALWEDTSIFITKLYARAHGLMWRIIAHKNIIFQSNPLRNFTLYAYWIGYSDSFNAYLTVARIIDSNAM